MKNLKLLFVLGLLCSGCATVPDVEICTVAGVVSAGAVCTTSNTGKDRDMSMDEFLDWLAPLPPQGDLDGRSGAMCMSADDWSQLKTYVESSCRLMGSRCTYEMRRLIARMSPQILFHSK